MTKTIAYLIDHSKIGIDAFAIIALIFLIAVIVYFIVMHQRRKKKTEELEKEISEFYEGAEKSRAEE
mgnify:CR=1 FL=1